VALVSIFYQAFWWLTRVIEIVVVVWVVISWVLFFAAQTSFRWRYKTAFSILNQLNEIFTRMTYPFLRPFRKILPPWKTAGIDWSPLLLLLAIFILRGVAGWLYGLILFSKVK
jgi:uncharacterized protein YggT (Ycf19 family)